MSSYAGLWPLLRLALRRDRIKLPAWLLGIAVMTAYFGNALQVAYPAQEDLEAIMGFLDSPAGVVMSGPGYGLDDPSHATVFAGGYALYLFVAAAFMGILLVGRHTRAEEEAGRLELVRAAPVGRHTPLAVAGILAIVANLALFLLTWVFLSGTGFGFGSTALFAAGQAMVGLVFAGVAMVTAQLAEHSRSATGLASLVLGTAVVIRGAGDVLQEHGSPLSWLSPIAWAQQTRVFDDDRWWPLALGVVLTAVAFALAWRLQARRDLTAGILATRLGRPRASARLRNAFRLAMRLERGAMVGWGIALLVAGALYGALTGSVESSLADVENEILINALGGDPSRLVDGYLATDTMFSAFVVACYVITAAHRLSSEERAGRTEVVLATAVSRPRWLLAGLATSLVGATVLLAASGIGMGSTAALTTGEAAYFAEVFLGSLYYLPAIALLVTVAVLGFSVRPGWVNLAWLVAVYAFLITYLGNLLDVPGILQDLSPFTHVALVPLEEQAAAPLVILVLLAAALVAASLARFRTRDITTT